VEPAELTEFSYGINDGFIISATDGSGIPIPNPEDILGHENGLVMEENSYVLIESALTPVEYKLVYFEIEAQNAVNMTLTLELVTGEMQSFEVITRRNKFKCN
jgi:hypothetical protein